MEAILERDGPRSGRADGADDQRGVWSWRRARAWTGGRGAGRSNLERAGSLNRDRRSAVGPSHQGYVNCVQYWRGSGAHTLCLSTGPDRSAHCPAEVWCLEHTIYSPHTPILDVLFSNDQVYFLVKLGCSFNSFVQRRTTQPTCLRSGALLVLLLGTCLGFPTRRDHDRSLRRCSREQSSLPHPFYHSVGRPQPTASSGRNR